MLISLILSIALWLAPATDPEPAPAGDCVPGVCCDGCRTLADGTSWCLGCTPVTGAAMCGGSYLPCGSGCGAVGESGTCHTGTAFNECCS